MDPRPATLNARSHVPDMCSAVAKAAGLVAICDLIHGHEGPHLATLANGKPHSWVEEPW